MTRPNILFIFTDQQAANMMSCTGNNYLKTPHMDKLAAAGIRFERAYCANPLCSPSRCSLLTGRYPSKLNVYGNDLTKAVVGQEIFENGLGYLFKKNGYNAVYAGKQHVPFSVEKIGFDIISKNQRDEIADTCADYVKKNNQKPFLMIASFINPHDICFMSIDRFAAADDPLRNFGRGAIDKVRTILREADEVSASGPPDQTLPPLPVNFELQENEPEAISIYQNQGKHSFMGEARKKYTEPDWRKHRYLYSRLTETADTQMGRIIDALEESGQMENTVIIFSSDHGEIDGAHKLEHKDLFYEECCRVPLIISPAAVPGMIDNEHIISNGLDIIKTIIDYAGIEQPSFLTGKSLKSLAENKNNYQPRTYLKIESQLGKAVVSKNYKYAVYNEGKNNEQLYDRINDPGEMRNAVNDADKQLILEKHRKALNS